MLDLFKQFEDDDLMEDKMDKAFQELSEAKRTIQDSINTRHEALHHAIDVLEGIINDEEISTDETNEKATKILDDIDKILLKEQDKASEELDKLLEELM